MWLRKGRGRAAERLWLFRNDRGSLPMALLVSIVGFALGAMMLPLVLTQNSLVQATSQRSSDLNVAQSGLQMALGQLRTAGHMEAGEFVGDLSKLPCGPIRGTADPVTGDQFEVTITYSAAVEKKDLFDANPQKSRKLVCVPGFGVVFSPGAGFDPGEDLSIEDFVPKFALLSSRSFGGNSGNGRVLQAIFMIQTDDNTNADGTGGTLPLYPELDDHSNPKTKYCLTAPDEPEVGSQVTITECPEDGTLVANISPRQKWTYLRNLTLRLTRTVGNTSLNEYGTGLCIKANATGAVLTLVECPENDSDGWPKQAGWELLWSVNDSGHFESATSSRGLSGNCINAGTLSNDASVTLAGCDGGTQDPHQAFNPAGSVGAGAAGPDNDQIANFLLFSRCVDVTNWSADTGDNGGSFLILYPCKQNPDPGAVGANQKFVQEVRSVSNGTVQFRTSAKTGSGAITDSYCLTSSGTANGTAFVKTCNSGNAAQTWIRYEDTDAAGNPIPVKKMYTIVDYQGRCLDFTTIDLYNGNSKTITAECNGLDSQKWNNPGIPYDQSLDNFHESSGAG